MTELDWEEIWSCHSSIAEDLSLLGCDTVSLGEWFTHILKDFRALDCWALKVKALLSFRMWAIWITHPVTQYHLPGNWNLSDEVDLLTVVFWCRSFVPPVRDEESETQRKAHAKRVRETRRSTQGVTLEEIKVAEQLVKKKNQQQLHQATQQLGNSEQVHCLLLLLRISVRFFHC